MVDRPGLFVAFEGIDGAGKTTTSRLVVTALAKRGIDAQLVHKRGPWPGVSGYPLAHLTELADLVWTRAVGAPTHLLGDAHWVRLHAAYFAAIGHCVVSPLLDAGRWVVMDNWYYKFVARIATDSGWPLPDFAAAFAPVRNPDVVVFLDVPPAEAARRKATFTNSEVGGRIRPQPHTDPAAGFEAYQRRVLATYHRLVDPRTWWTVPSDGHGPDEICAEVVERLSGRRSQPEARE